MCNTFYVYYFECVIYIFYVYYFECVIYTFNVYYFKCVIFHFRKVGFSTTANLLENYGRKGWLASLVCNGDEANIMQCSHSRFGATPTLAYTYSAGTWLYCFGKLLQHVY